MSWSKCEQCSQAFEFDDANEVNQCPQCGFETRLFPVRQLQTAELESAKCGIIPSDIPRNRHNSNPKNMGVRWSVSSTTRLGLAVVGLALVATLMANPEDFREGIMLGGFYLVASLIYFMPAILAHQNSHHQARAITVLNVVAGWTFVGWVVALVWVYIKPNR